MRLAKVCQPVQATDFSPGSPTIPSVPIKGSAWTNCRSALGSPIRMGEPGGNSFRRRSLAPLILLLLEVASPRASGRSVSAVPKVAADVAARWPHRRVMVHVRDEGSITVSEIEDLCSISKEHALDVIAALGEQGLVETAPDPVDIARILWPDLDRPSDTAELRSEYWLTDLGFDVACLLDLG